MSLTTSDLLETIAKLNRDSGRPNHPLYRALETGGLNRKQVQYFCKQNSIIPLYNHNLHGRLYVSCPDPEFRERLAEVTYEEGTGRLYANGVPHYKLYINYAKALGIGREELYATEFCGSAEGVLLFLSDTCGRFIEGIASVMLVGEAQGPGSDGRIAKMHQREFGLDDDAVAFWTVHDKADDDHSDAGRQILDRFVKTDAERKLVIDVARRSNKIRRLMYDEVWENMQALR